MKVLITGATGFLGTHLVERLLQEIGREGGGDSALRVLCRGRSPWEGHPAVETARGDILDAAAVDRAVDGVAEIYHLAGLVTRDPRSAARLFDVHVRGTRHLCEGALRRGKPRMVLASSSGTIAVSTAPKRHDEQAPYAIDVVRSWPYYLSKVYQEKLAWAYHRDHGLPVIIANPSLLLGPGDTRLSSTGDIRRFLNGYVRTVPGGALNFVDVRDLAALLPRLMRDGVPGRRYLIGGHNMSFDEFFALLARVSGRSRPRLRVSERTARASASAARVLYRLVGRTFPLDDLSIQMAYRYWEIDNSRVRSEFGFAPRPAEETLRDTVEFLRSRRSQDSGLRTEC